MSWSRIELPAADVSMDADWLSPAQADALFDDLRRGIPWSVHRLRLFGREIDSPRLSCWIGDAGANYTYSGTRFEPHPWPQALVPIRERLVEETGVAYNSVLANLYRDGADTMGWHSDNEAALGVHPVIASLSLGAARRFVFKRREARHAAGRSGTPGADSAVGAGRLALLLPHGSLLLMRGETQGNYRHALPRTSRPVAPRINLTFRRIVG